MYATQAKTSMKSVWMIPSFRTPFPISALYKVQKQEKCGALNQKPKGTGSRSRRFSSITLAASKMKLKIRSLFKGELVILSDSGILTWEVNPEFVKESFYMCFLSSSERELLSRNPKDYFRNSAISNWPEIERIPISETFGGKEIPEFSIYEHSEVSELRNGEDIGVDIRVPELAIGEDVEVPELTISGEIVVPELKDGKDIAVPELTISGEIVVPELKDGEGTVVPELTISEDIVVPELNDGEDIAVPELTIGEDIVVPELKDGEDIAVPELTISEDIVVADLNDGKTISEDEVPKLTDGEDFVVPEVKDGEDIVVAGLNDGEDLEVPELTISEDTVVPELKDGENIAVPELTIGEVIVVPELTISGDIVVPEVKDGEDIGEDTPVLKTSSEDPVPELNHGEDIGVDIQVSESSFGREIPVPKSNSSKDSPVSKLSIDTFVHESAIGESISSTETYAPSTPTSSIKESVTPSSSISESVGFNVQRIIAGFETIIRNNKATTPLTYRLIESYPRPRQNFDMQLTKELLPLLNQFSTVEPSNNLQHLAKTEKNRRIDIRCPPGPGGRGDAQLIFSDGFVEAVGFCSPNILTETMLDKVDRFCCSQEEYSSFGIGTIQGYLEGHASCNTYEAGKKAGMSSAEVEEGANIEKMYRIKDCVALVKERYFGFGLEYLAPGILDGELYSHIASNLAEGDSPKGYNEGYLNGFLECGYLDGYVEGYIEYGTWILLMKSLERDEAD